MARYEKATQNSSIVGHEQAMSRALPLLGKVDEVLYEPRLLKVDEKE
jgi:hypothetical protein